MYVGRYSSFGIATRYGQFIESRWRRDIPHPSRRVFGYTQPPIKWVAVLSTGGLANGAWRWPPATSSAEVKERIFVVPLWVFVACTRVTLTFNIYFYNGMCNIKFKRFRKLSRTADLNSAGHGMPITASILTPPLQEQSLAAKHLFCEREKHELNTGLQIMALHP
jgi:hypothetical protein